MSGYQENTSLFITTTSPPHITPHAFIYLLGSIKQLSGGILHTSKLFRSVYSGADTRNAVVRPVPFLLSSGFLISPFLWGDFNLPWVLCCWWSLLRGRCARVGQCLLSIFHSRGSRVESRESSRESLDSPNTIERLTNGTTVAKTQKREEGPAKQGHGHEETGHEGPA